MNYFEAREYLNKALKRGSILGLENITNLMKQLGNPQDKLNIVHIAGTNGKGSTTSYISEILINAGYRVGKYTSPSVFEYLEIFKINNVNISTEDYSDVMTTISEKITIMKNENLPEPTAFEIETALAFEYFKRQACDIVLIETGLGGRYDATNVVNSPICSVITSISMDHMNFLGNSLYEIASNKAGIIKSGGTVITTHQENEAMEAIITEAKKVNSKVIVSKAPTNIIFSLDGTTFDYINEYGIKYKKIFTTMLGTFQPVNIALAIETVSFLKTKGFLIYEENILKGIEKAKWHGRFDKILDKPLVYFDGGHNPGAAREISKTIELYFTNRKIIYIMGVLADKDYEKVLSYTGKFASKILTITPPDNERALDGRVLCETARKYNEFAVYCDNLNKAVSIALEEAKDDGIILVFGSLSYLAKILQEFNVTLT